MGNTTKNRWSRLLVIPVLILTALVATPVFLFSPTGLTFLLPKLNPLIEGELSIDSCSVGYLDSIRCRNVEYRLPHRGITISSSLMETDRGLLKLLAAPQNSGEIYLDGPEIHLANPLRSMQRVFADKRTGGQGLTTGGTGAVGEEGTSDLSLEPVKPFWEGRLFRLRVQNGKIGLADGEKPPLEPLENIGLRAVLEDGTITFALDVAQGGGTIDVNGFFNLPVDNRFDISTLIAKTELKVEDVEIASLLEFFTGLQGDEHVLPIGEGTLNAEIRVSSAGYEKVEVQAHGAIDSLSLSEGFLEDDAPFFEQLRLEINAERTGENSWHLSRGELESDIFSLTGTGKVTEGKGELSFQGKVSLPGVFAHFPHSLKANDQVVINQGEVSFTGGVRGDKGKHTIAVDCSTSALQGRFLDQPIFWADPLAVSVRARGSEGAVTVSEAGLVTPFMKLEGKEGPEGFLLSGVTDVKEMLLAAGTLFDVPWRGNGKVTFHGKVKEAGNNLLSTGFELNSEDFALERHGVQSLAEHPLSIRFDAVTPRVWFRGEDASQVELEVESLLGTMHLQTGNMVYADGLSGGFIVNSELVHQPMFQFIGSITGLEPAVRLEGVSTWSLEGRWEEPLLTLSRVEVDTEDLIARSGDREYRYGYLTLRLDDEPAPEEGTVLVRPMRAYENRDDYREKGLNGPPLLINFGSRSLRLNELSLDSGKVKIPTASVQVNDWDRFTDALSIELVAVGWLEDLPVNYAGNGKGEELRVEGKGVVDVQVEGEGDLLRAELNLLAQNTRIHHGDRQLVPSGEVTAGVHVQQVNDNRFSLSKIELYSPLGAFIGDGNLQRTNGGSGLEVSGAARPAASLFPDLLAGYLKEKPVVGKWLNGSLQASIPLPSGGQDAAPSVFDYDGELEYISYRGIQLVNPEFSVSRKQDPERMLLRGELNDGRFALAWNRIPEGNGMKVVIDESQQVFTGVPLDRSFIREVAARMHPLFGTLSRPQGSLSIAVEELEIPENAPGDMRFVAGLDLDRIRLQGGLLEEIMDFFGPAEEELLLKSTELTCRGEEHRVSCTPVEIFTAGSEMVIAGSMGYDGSLDFEFTIPVTNALIGEQGYRVLEGAHITLPINGTVDEPYFNRDYLRHALAGLMKQAKNRADEKQVETEVPGFLENILGQ